MPTMITTPGGERLVLLPEAEWRHLVAAAQGRPAQMEAVTIPADVANRVFAGEQPARVFRQWRGLNARSVATAAGISAGYLSDIESGRRRPSPETRAAIAAVLGLEAEDLVPARID